MSQCFVYRDHGQWTVHRRWNYFDGYLHGVTRKEAEQRAKEAGWPTPTRLKSADNKMRDYELS